MVLVGQAQEDVAADAGVGAQERERLEGDLRLPAADDGIDHLRLLVELVRRAERALQVDEFDDRHRCLRITERRPLLREPGEQRARLVSPRTASPGRRLPLAATAAQQDDHDHHDERGEDEPARIWIWRFRPLEGSVGAGAVTTRSVSRPSP